MTATSITATDLRPRTLVPVRRRRTITTARTSGIIVYQATTMAVDP